MAGEASAEIVCGALKRGAKLVPRALQSRVPEFDQWLQPTVVVFGETFRV